MALEPQWQCSSVGGKGTKTRVERDMTEEGKREVSLKSSCPTEKSSLDRLSSTGGCFFFPLAPSVDPDSVPPTSVAPLKNIYPQVWSFSQIRICPSRALNLIPAGEPKLNSECFSRRRLSRFFCSSSFNGTKGRRAFCRFLSRFVSAEESQVPPR